MFVNTMLQTCLWILYNQIDRVYDVNKHTTKQLTPKRNGVNYKPE